MSAKIGKVIHQSKTMTTARMQQRVQGAYVFIYIAVQLWYLYRVHTRFEKKRATESFQIPKVEGTLDSSRLKSWHCGLGKTAVRASHNFENLHQHFESTVKSRQQSRTAYQEPVCPFPSVMAEQLIHRGTLEGHSGWVTSLATSLEKCGASRIGAGTS